MTDTPYSDELDEILGNLREDAVEYGEELHHGKVKSDDDIKLASEKLLNVQSEAKQRLSRLLIEAKIDAAKDATQSAIYVLTGSDDFRIEPGVDLGLNMGQITKVRETLYRMKDAYQAQLADIEETK